VAAFRRRRLDHVQFPCVYLEATYLHVRNATSQVVLMAAAVATGITADGGREVRGLDEISEEHAGLVAALKRSFQGTAHQRCRVHFARPRQGLEVPSSSVGGRRSGPRHPTPGPRRATSREG
jgi:putative transposase